MVLTGHTFLALVYYAGPDVLTKMRYLLAFWTWGNIHVFFMLLSDHEKSSRRPSGIQRPGGAPQVQTADPSLYVTSRKLNLTTEWDWISPIFLPVTANRRLLKINPSETCQLLEGCVLKTLITWDFLFIFFTVLTEIQITQNKII